jgi:hypothetical protein
MVHAGRNGEVIENKGRISGKRKRIAARLTGDSNNLNHMGHGIMGITVTSASTDLLGYAAAPSERRS